MICGGAKQKEITQEIVDLCDQMTEQMTEKSQLKGRNGSISELVPVPVLVQVVAGLNYFIKARSTLGFLAVGNRWLNSLIGDVG
jgi:hypothetical protein